LFIAIVFAISISFLFKTVIAVAADAANTPTGVSPVLTTDPRLRFTVVLGACLAIVIGTVALVHGFSDHDRIAMAEATAVLAVGVGVFTARGFLEAKDISFVKRLAILIGIGLTMGMVMGGLVYVGAPMLIRQLVEH